MKRMKSPIKIPRARAGDQPATRGMLTALKKELKSEISSLERRIDVKFTGLQFEFTGLKHEFSGLKLEFAELKSEIGEMKVSIDRTNVLVEEQNSNNRIVLEGLQALWQRQDRLEAGL